MNKNEEKTKKLISAGILLKAIKKTALFVLLLLAIFSISVASVYIYLLNRFYPGVYVAAVDLGFLDYSSAQQKLDRQILARKNKNLDFVNPMASASGEKRNFSLNLSQITTIIKSDQALDQAFLFGHSNIYLYKINIPVEFEFDNNMGNQLKTIADQINQPAVNSSLKIIDDQIVASPSQDGYVLNEDELKKRITGYLNTGTIPDKSLPIKKVTPRLSYTSALKIKKRLDEIKLSPLKLIFKDQVFSLDLNQILQMIDLENTKSTLVQGTVFDNSISIESIDIGTNTISDTQLTLNRDKISNFLADIGKEIDRPVEEPLFQIEETSDPKKPKIKEFRPPQDGQKIDIEKSGQKIADALVNQTQNTVKLVVNIVPPKNKLTNDLGIKELISEGVSNFAGSIQNRMYNIGLAASRINGVLIPPGEVFSFNQNIGDITAGTGYKQAYVIKSGRTVLDDGGGVCQVSTTVFRAALNAGLPIVERTAHAYRVGYYEQGFGPGLDATIFYPSVDFKFKNDTDHHILVQAYVQGTSLYVDLFGTSDGRTTNITKPVILSQTPPLPEIRQDDPTLPRGTVKQVDFAAWGANVVFSRTVVRNGQTLINETFKSNFRPWQAVFLVGTKDG